MPHISKARCGAPFDWWLRETKNRLQTADIRMTTAPGYGSIVLFKQGVRFGQVSQNRFFLSVLCQLRCYGAFGHPGGGHTSASGRISDLPD